MLNRGANPNISSLNETTPLILACRFHLSFELILLLLRKSADPNVRNRDGQTALQWAVWHDDIELAKILLIAGANPLVIDTHTRNAIDCSRSQMMKVILSQASVEFIES